MLKAIAACKFPKHGETSYKPAQNPEDVALTIGMSCRPVASNYAALVRQVRLCTLDLQLNITFVSTFSKNPPQIGVRVELI